MNQNQRNRVIRYRNKKLTEAICDTRDHVIETGGYPYTLHPFQAVFPQDTSLIENITLEMIQNEYFESDFDYVFALAQKSIPFATILALKTGKPLLIAYSRSYDKPSKEMKETEIKIIEPKKYADPFVLYSYFLNSGDRVTFVGDDVNWGDAMICTANEFSKKGICISNFVLGVEKTDRGGVKKLQDFLTQSNLFSKTSIHIGASVSIVGNKMIENNEI